ncbi:Glycosyltransferase involved in cell wall bisynthesis [Flavobacteriaceae bacterium MAR_2010_188]|nr:Glycosyltransferase involved in cell wall bisynthesis [Flavobacteriaceae bacterium MAR_2010_188]
MNPLVSVIIPTFNRAHILSTAIDSVLNQTYVDVECIVIDDGSSDNTKLLIDQFFNDERLKYHLRDRKPKGASTCRNIGLSQAKGDFVVFLDSDDYLLPHCIEQRIAKVLKTPKLDFAVFPMQILKDGKLQNHLLADKNLLIEFLSCNALWQTMCPIYSKEFLIKLGGFAEGYPRFNDLEIAIRSVISTKNFEIFPDLSADSVHIPSSMDSLVLLDKVYNSHLEFIPDISVDLDKADLSGYKKFLIFYLHAWFKFIYIPSGSKEIGQSLTLINLYRKKKIFDESFALKLKLRCLLYLGTSLIGYPLNKLSDKGIYQHQLAKYEL